MKLTRTWCVAVAALAAVSAASTVVAAPGSPDQWEETCVPGWFDPLADSVDESTIRSLARGSDGFIYVGGDTGLYRLEGGRTRVWYPESNQEGALPAGFVRTMIADDSGLWLGTGAGLVYFDFATDTFTPVPHAPPGEIVPRITNLEIQGNTLYVGDAEGGATIDLSERRLRKPFQRLPDGSRFQTYDLIEHDDAVYAATDAGVLLVGKDGAVRVLAPWHETPGTNRNHVYAFAKSPEGELWMVTRLGVGRARLDEGFAIEDVLSHELPQLSGSRFEVLTFDSKGRLWLGSRDQVVRWNRGETRPLRCSQVGGANSDRDISITFLASLDGDYMSFGSFGSYMEVARLDTAVQRVVMGERYNPGLPRSVLWTALMHPDGRLYLASQDGLYRQRTPGSADYELVAPDGIGEQRVRALALDDAGRLWVVTGDGALVLEGDSVTALEPVTNADGSIRYPTTNSLEPYGSRMLIGGSSGVLVVDTRTLEFERFFRTKPGRRTINDAPTTDLEAGWISMIHAVDDRVFVAANSAAYRLDIDRGEVLASTITARREGRITFGGLESVIATQDGETVYLGTELGLLRTDADMREFENLAAIGGVRLGGVNSAARTRDGDLWMGATGRGLIRVPASGAPWEIYTRRDGLHSNGFSDSGLEATGDGRVIAVASGASVIDAAHLRRPGKQVSLFARVDGRRIDPGSGEPLTLPGERRSLSIEFLTPDLVDTGLYEVEYALVEGGMAGSPVRVSFSETLRLANLAPGNYALQARVVGFEGFASELLELQFDVPERWWETDMAQALGAILLALLLVLIALWRAQVRYRRFELITGERRRIAQELHDTFLQEVFGALALGRSLESGQVQGARKLQRLNELLQGAASSARASVNELAAERSELPIVEELRQHAPPSLLASGARYSVKEEGRAWPMSAKRAFFLSRVAKEAVTNAAKHGRPDTIEVVLTWRPNRLRIQVSDDGIGFEPDSATKQEGFGLAAMARMACEGRADLRIDSRPGEGTRICLRARRFWL